MRVIIFEASKDSDLIPPDMADAIITAEFRLDTGRIEVELLKLVRLSVEQKYVWQFSLIHESAQNNDFILVYRAH